MILTDVPTIFVHTLDGVFQEVTANFSLIEKDNPIHLIEIKLKEKSIPGGKIPTVAAVESAEYLVGRSYYNYEIHKAALLMVEEGFDPEWLQNGKLHKEAISEPAAFLDPEFFYDNDTIIKLQPGKKFYTAQLPDAPHPSTEPIEIIVVGYMRESNGEIDQAIMLCPIAQRVFLAATGWLKLHCRETRKECRQMIEETMPRWHKLEGYIAGPQPDPFLEPIRVEKDYFTAIRQAVIIAQNQEHTLEETTEFARSSKCYNLAINSLLVMMEKVRTTGMRVHVMQRGNVTDIYAYR